MMTLKLYLIGSLRNPKIPQIAGSIRALGTFDVFDDWFAAGPEADDKWKDYEQQRGRTYEQALEGLAADHVFGFDLGHLSSSHLVVLVLPAGRSGHLELGYSCGLGKHCVICIEDDSERWDVMYRFAQKVVRGEGELIEYLKGIRKDSITCL